MVINSSIDYVDADPDSDRYLQRTIHCPECGKVCPIEDDICNECGNYLDVSVVEEELKSRIRIDEFEEDPETGELVLRDDLEEDEEDDFYHGALDEFDEPEEYEDEDEETEENEDDED